MKKLIILILFFLQLFAGNLSAQSMRSLFVDAPDSILPLLTRTNREDCIDFLEAKMRARVTNRFDGTSELMLLTDDFLELRNSENSTVQMKLLPFAGDTVIAMVKSVCAEACSSRIVFYKKDWSLAEISFERPQIAEFFVSADSLDKYIDLCDIYLVQLSLSPSAATLTAEYTMPAYMNERDSKNVTPSLRPVVYGWSGRAFVKE